MIMPIYTFTPPRQGGAAAVELALLLPILVLLLMFPLFYARYFWYYTAVQKAANDAARYLSTISEKEMRMPTLAQAAAAVANDIAKAEIAELTSSPLPSFIDVRCGTRACGGVGDGALPQTVAVTVEVTFADDIFRAVNTGPLGWRVTAEVEMRYVGN